MGPREIIRDVFLIGDCELTDPMDCSVYLINLGDMVLIDTGAGTSVERLIFNIRRLGLKPENITTIILTHCHIDHIGGAYELKKRFGSKIIMHSLDAKPVEHGDRTMTGAYLYGVPLIPTSVDLKLEKEEESLFIGEQEIRCLHTPGHTPGSLSVYLDRDEKRVLFGQDIHGPFLPQFGSDIKKWRASMEKLLQLKADILCEGHFGIFQPSDKVNEYIENYLEEYGD
ncbi:MAG: MBL fold metallo-hydrolase [Syntrophorhabdaceae bacterium]|nr:MBL fold metallo-hydrolase [Syntrophorhabdaceae bacterium]